MCEEAKKLIFWLDQELPPGPAAEFESHLEICAECRDRVATYRNVSAQIGDYCEEALAATEHPASRKWTPLAQAAIGAAAFMALALAWAWPRTRTAPQTVFEPERSASVRAPVDVAAPLTRPQAVPVPAWPVHRHKDAAVTHQEGSVTSTQTTLAANYTASTLPAEPVIRIAIPAEEIFPEGAVPQGMNFYADVSIAPDGSAERLQLHPRLASFERRSSLP